MKKRGNHLISRLFAGSLLVGFFVFALAQFIPFARAASAPNVISYQGRLLNANGVPVAATSANVIFELYDASAAGTCLWSNSSSTCLSASARSVDLTGGLFSENLGDTGDAYAAIPDSVFANNGTVYLQVTIEGEALTPRKQIASAPYALNSDSLDGLDSDNDGATSAAIAAFNASGALVITGNPSGAGVGAGSLYVNPASLDTAANDTIFGIADGGTERFRVDKEGDVFVGGVALNGVGTGPTDSGSSLVGVFDELTYSSADNVQDVLDDLDTAIATISGGASYWTDAATYTYLTATTEDLVIGDSTIAGASFYFDTSAGSLFLGTDGAVNGSVTLYSASAGLSPSFTTNAAGNLYLTAADQVFVDYGDHTLASIIDDGLVGHVFSSNGYQTAAGTGLDTSAAGALTIGNTAATSVSVCNSAACDTITIGSNADADTITIGDSTNDTVSINGSSLSFVINSTTVSGSEITVLDGGITNAELTDTGTFTATTVDINGGAIDGTAIGATSPSTGAFTTLSSTGATTIGNNTATVAINSSDWDIGVTGDVSGIGAFTMDGAFSQTGATTFSTGTGAVSLNGDTTVASGKSLFTSTLDTAAAGALAVGNVNATSVSLCNSSACDTVTIGSNADADAITIGDSTNDTVTVNGSSVAIVIGGTTVSGSEITVLDGGIANSELTDSGTFTATTVDINGGAIDGTAIGATSPSSGAFTTLSSTGVTTIGNGSATVAINSSDWGISSTGAITNIASITGNDNQTNLLTNIGVTGTDALTHTIDFQIDGTSQLSIAADGDGAGGVSSPVLTIASRVVINNDAGTNLTSLGTGSTTGTVTLGGTGTQSIRLGDGAGNKTVTLGSSNTSSTTTIRSGSGGLNLNVGNNQPTNINTSTSTGLVSIGGGSGTLAIDTTVFDVTAAGLLTTADDIAVNGGDITSTAATFNFLDAASNSTNIEIGGVTVDRGNSISIATNSTSPDVIAIGNTNGSSTLALSSGTWTISTAGLLTTADDVAVNGGDVTSTSSTFNLLDAASNSTTIEIGGVTTDLGNTVRIATNATTADSITIGNTTATTTLALSSGTWNMASTGVLTMTATSAQTTALVITDTDYTNALSIGDNNIIGTTAAIDFTNFDVSTAGAITVAGGQGIDTSGAGALALGNVNSTSVTICNSANCDSVTLGTNTDADIIAVGDSSNLDTVTVNSANWQMAATGNLNSSGDIDFNGSSSFGDTSGADQLTVTSATTTGNVILVNSDNLTSGTGLDIGRSGGVTGNFTGSLINLHQDRETGAASTGTALTVSNASTVGKVATFTSTGATQGATGVTITMESIANASANAVTGQALVIDINESANSDEVLLVRADADGTPNTTLRLDNSGNLSTDGTVGGGGADFAEYFYTTDSSLGDGMTVCRDESTSNGVKRCDAGADGVMGVISTNPAFIGNTAGAEDAHAADPHYRVVGLLGQVDTYVSADDGAIAVGDALTVSSTLAGYAGKSNSPTGIVGFALESMASGRGKIKVLVQPQWYGGDVLGSDGNALAISSGVKLSALRNATASTPAVDSNALSLVGSAWNGVSAEKVGLSLAAKVNSATDYRLAIQNQAGAEVASFNQAGDLKLSGKLYPSDRGIAQSSAYIYYDSSAGPGYMKTNAAGWSVGSYDFAEMFPSADQLAVGEVVTFGSSPQSVMKSTGKTYDGKIAGVVSTRPGFLAGDYKAGSYPIALAGRVPTKVTSENGSIAVGDPLTTSSRAGYAMKATKPGQILGYAMESMTAGEGTVVAFIRASYYAGEGTGSAANTSLSGAGSFGTLNVTGALNMNGGNVLSIGALEGIGGAWKIAENGDFTTRGQITKKITSVTGGLVDAFAITSPEVTVQLSGTATLQNGQVAIDFDDSDPDFKNIISTGTAYRVFLTPSGITGQLYAAERSNEGFTVHDAQGSSGITVDWLVIAYERNHEPDGSVAAEPPTPSPVVTEDPVTSDILADNGVITPEEDPAGEVAGETVSTDDVIVPDTTESLVSEPPVDETLSTLPESEIMPSTQETPAEEPVNP
jgi:hypothetical protein